MVKRDHCRSVSSPLYWSEFLFSKALKESFSLGERLYIRICEYRSNERGQPMTCSRWNYTDVQKEKMCSTERFFTPTNRVMVAIAFLAEVVTLQQHSTAMVSWCYSIKCLKLENMAEERYENRRESL